MPRYAPGRMPALLPMLEAGEAEDIDIIGGNA